MCIIGRKTKKLTFAKRLMVQAIPTLPTPTTVTLCVLVGTGSITVFNSLLLNDAIILYINSRIGSIDFSLTIRRDNARNRIVIAILEICLNAREPRVKAACSFLIQDV